MYKHFFKRMLDIVLSGLALIILSPILLIVAILVRVKLGSPVIFKQERPGYKGKIFKMYKFRTMLDPQTRDGRKLTDKERLECIEKGIDILTDEERLPKLGRVLRAASLDELPELWNIFVSDMSIVGPRPERPEIAREYKKTLPEFDLRLQCKCGLTGFAQVYGQYNTTPYDKLLMDLMYIAQPSMAEDLKICFATVKILFEKESTEGVDAGAVTAAKFNKKEN